MARAVTESAMMAALSFVLYLASNIPLLGGFVSLLCPIPLTYVVLRHGLRRGTLSCACTCVLLTVVGGGPASAYLFLMAFGLTGLVCGWVLRRDEPPVAAFAKGVLLLSVLFAPLLVFVGRVVGAGETFEAGVQLVLKQWDAFSAMFSDPNVIQMLQDQKKIFLCIAYVPILPVVLSSILGLYFQHLVTWMFSRRLGVEVRPPPNPYHLRLPPWLPILFLIAMQRQAVLGAVPTVEASLACQLAETLTWCLYFAGVAAGARYLSPKKELPIPTFFGMAMFAWVFGAIPIWVGLFDTLAGRPAPSDAPAVPPDVKPATRS